jgi:hypothetical protein
MRFDLVPHVGIGELRFGMSRAEVEELLGPPERALPPDPFVGDVQLFYESSSLAVSIDARDRVCAIESRGCELVLDGRDLRAETWPNLMALILGHDPEASVEEGGLSLTSRRLGLAVNTADEELPQGLLVFEPGYFERPRRDKADYAAWIAEIAAKRRERER